MIPHITRGGNTRGVIRYLLGNGRREEHQDPQLVAGSPEATRHAAGRLLELRDAGPLAEFLDEPREAFGVRVTIRERDQEGRVAGHRDAHVWHCSLSLHPDEPALSGERWGHLAERFVGELRFAGEDTGSQCRWLAVSHGPSMGGSDHIHLVVVLVAEDGSKAVVHNDRPRAQAACRQLEREFGLRELEARSRGGGERSIEPGELESDRRRGRPVGDRRNGDERPEGGSRRTLERLVRACAVAAGDEANFVATLRGEGVVVRARYEPGGTSKVDGYSVALRPPDGERPVWFGGGKLSRELTLPRLRENWPALGPAQLADAWQTRGQRQARTRVSPSIELQAQCARELEAMQQLLREVPAGEHGTWAHVARAASGVFAAWSLRMEPEPGPLAYASRTLARTGQLRRRNLGRRRWQTINPAQRTAGLLLAANVVSGSSAGLMRQMVGVCTAIAKMHAAAGDVARAAELEQLARRELAAVTQQFTIRDQPMSARRDRGGGPGLELPGAGR